MNKMFFMLTYLIIILTSGCHKGDEPTGPSSSSSSNLNSISGTIPNYNLGASKTIRLTYWGNAYSDYPNFGSGIVDADGNFNIASLSAVPDNLLEPLSDIPTGVNVSDPSAKIKGGCTLRIYTASATKPTHTVDKGIFHSPSQAGDYYINFIYSDRACSVQGTEISSNYIYNFEMKKGWNKLIQLVKQTNPLIMEYKNEEPVGGYWYLYEM